jgi:hypothetical protein
MKSKSLLGMVQLAAMVAIGATQMHQAMPVLAKLAQRTAAPLEQMVRLGINPSYPRSPVPAVQPSAFHAVQVCDRTPSAPARYAQFRHAVVRVEAPRPVIETIDSPVAGRVMQRRVYTARFDQHAFETVVQMNQVVVQREIARAQRELQRAMREAQREQTVVF